MKLKSIIVFVDINGFTKRIYDNEHGGNNEEFIVYYIISMKHVYGKQELRVKMNLI